MLEEVGQDDAGEVVRREGVIVYDGECSFCLRQVERMRRRDVDGLFEMIPRQEPGLTERFSQLLEGDFNRGMRLIRPDGRVLVGADAIYGIARRLRRWRWFAWLYRVPLLHGLCKWGYGWIAANRNKLGRKCDAECGTK